jgi:phenylacetate-CoA ligase
MTTGREWEQVSAKERWLECVRRWRVQPDAPGAEDCWAPELELASPGHLKQIQSEKIAAAAAYLYEDSPFYRGKFDEAGLRPADVRSVEDLWKVPITRKQEWADDVLRHPPWGTFSPLKSEDWGRHGFMLFTSSGVTGAPRAFRHTAHDRDLWAWMWARALWAQGVRPGDVLINCIGYGPYTAYWGAHYAMNLIGCPVIPGSGVPAEGRAAYIDAYSPTVLTCTPSHGLHLAETMRRMGLDPAASSIRLVVAGGEQGACIPATKRRLEQAWGATALDVFGGAEVAMAPLGYQCAPDARRDRPPYAPHLMEDCYVVEIVDPSTGEPMPEGGTGITVVSNLFSEAQPILRFEMADLMLVTSAPCPCGRTHRRAVGGVLGREDDVLKVRGRAVQPSGFEAAVRSVAEAADEFEVVIDRREGGLDEVLIRVEAAPGASLDDRALAGGVVDAVRRELGLEASCEVVAAGTLRRTEGKARRVHDRRRAMTSGADRR